MREGRPLRFLGLALGGWTMVRVVFLLPDAATRPTAVPAGSRDDRSALIPALFNELAPVSAMAAPLPAGRGAIARTADTAAGVVALPSLSPPLSLPVSRWPPLLAAPPSPPIIAATSGTRPAPAMQAGQRASHDMTILPFPARPSLANVGRSRFAGSAWALARGGADGTLSGGQLGASQAGVRLTYALGPSRRFALTARLATPFAGRGREAALGVEWQPTRLPIRLVAERRFVLDGGAGGPMIGAIAGYGPAEIAPAVRIEAYGQAGVIARGGFEGGVEGFVDAAARVTHPIAAWSDLRIDGGIGVWTSAQRGAARFDTGPTLGLAVPVAGRSLRLSLDWRERLGGAARPGSGPALSIGTDF